VGHYITKGASFKYNHAHYLGKVSNGAYVRNYFGPIGHAVNGRINTADKIEYKYKEE
jgi:hypothetical protein